METVVLVLLALVVAGVAIDAIARLDERRPPKRLKPPARSDESLISTQKIVVDLSKRH
jgi:hypothetical protein